MSPSEWDNSVCMRGPCVVRAFLLIKRELFQRPCNVLHHSKEDLHSIINGLNRFEQNLIKNKQFTYMHCGFCERNRRGCHGVRFQKRCPDANKGVNP